MPSNSINPSSSGELSEAYPSLDLPDWFDDQLRDELARKVGRKRGILLFVDWLAFAVLAAICGDSDWRFQRPHSWSELEAMMQRDCAEIAGAGFSPQVVVGVKSGGAFIAKYVADQLEVERVEYIDVNHYAPLMGSAFLAVIVKYFTSAQITSSQTGDVSGQRVLIVDDQIRSGRSLFAARRWAEENGASETKTYCLFTQGARADYGNCKGIMMRSPWGDDP